MKVFHNEKVHYQLTYFVISYYEYRRSAAAGINMVNIWTLANRLWRT